MRAQINSEKHIVQYPIDTVLAGVAQNIELIVVNQAGGVGSTIVTAGTTVKAIFIELWLLGATSQVGSTTVIVEKLSSGASAPGLVSMADLHAYQNKKNILYTSEGLTADANGNPTPFIRQWLKIPKGKQRFGLGDSLVMTISPQADDTSRCGMAIYKAYN